jgi:acyl-CoA synthetase (AMP-forming)/AMP-acid ligase II
MVSSDMPDIRGTVQQGFQSSAEKYARNEFLCVLPGTAREYAIEPQVWSYEQAAREVARLQRLYVAAGIGHGHRVGLMLENRPAMFFHWLALNALGASAVPINTEWRSAELVYLIGHSELCVAVAPPRRADDIARAAGEAGREVIVTAPDLGGLQQVASPAPLAGRLPDADTECALLYTSGTTGRPKGCVLTNEYFLWTGTWYATVGGLCTLRPGDERLITPLPMTHMNAMAASTMGMMLRGGCIVPLDRFHPSTWWSSVRESCATVVHYLGVMPAMLLGAAPGPSDQEHCVRFGFGAGVSPRLHAPFERRFGFPLLEAWAMTETGSGAVIIANREPRKVGTSCFGRAEPRIDYRIVDECGEDAASGTPGELLVRHAGPQPRFGFFREYLKDPAATAAAWEGGYFHTGDIVQVDADGDFHFVDRKKNVIRRSGENISAVEVEGVLGQHPGVAEVGVCAVPDDVRGDEVMACIVPRPAVEAAGLEAFARDVVEFSLERLAYFKAPGYVALCEALPLTPTEKIQRAALKEQAQALLSSPACVDTRAFKTRLPRRL